MNWTAFTAQNPFLWQAAKVNRGYTFHEQLDPVGLVHMNGRVYDPEIGRFLSADPFVQDISNFQAFNAYSYVQNNPLSFTDPSGFFLSGLFKKIGRVFSNIARGFMGLMKTIARSGIARAILQIVACANPAAIFTCAPTAAALTLAAGGTLKQAIISAAISFAQLPLPGGGGIWGMVGNAVAISGTGFVGTVVTHAVIGGALSVAQGGSFVSGAISGAVSSVAGGLSAGLGDIGQLAVTAVAGGTASVLTGGKFANGAITAAFALMYNSWQHPDAGMTGTQSGISDQTQRDEVNAQNAITALIPEQAGAEMAAFAAGGELIGGAAAWARGWSAIADSELLVAARAMRDELSGLVSSLSGRLRPATVTAGYNIKTGQVAARGCAGGRCAEDWVVDALGGNKADIRFTEAVRPRTGNEVGVCPICEGNYGRGAFPKGTKFQTD